MPERKSANILVGPAGWSYPDWKGIVYPARTSRNFDPLVFISQYFNTIEINVTFYRIPPTGTVLQWCDKVRDRSGFMFTVKAYRGFSHEPEILSRDDIKAFNALLDHLNREEVLGAVLVQFPYRFHQNFENRKHLIKIKDHLSSWPLVAEFRHRSWLNPAVLNFLSELNMGFCAVDQPEVSASLPLMPVTTSSIGYLRCHGRNRENWFGPDSDRDRRYNYRYSKKELLQIAEVARQMSIRTERLFVIFNNHFQGNEIFDAAYLSELMGISRPWPSWWCVNRDE
ncbi:DUF72 domain-containing protein [Thermodesulforhabdus norvegica]|uniref:Uncharacterized conserved protein YecE, DUF72 family n=1 Tax=Thermodesulforhabdus norvegica TaxID=39841 RepID=A0A1I4QUQ8_9BACT|nr:DUF72 domain-containing protein [Thermodesulforhabdus norvegica]SFM43812.1 Uncharacterized conserved protein YecE, DUF72 family [Thermodesulforhabdus norvegica]